MFNFVHTSYLFEALKGDYAFDSEDRLSQLFSASFNNSPKFRKLFYNFSKIRPFPDPHAITQQCDQGKMGKGRLDICIYDGKKERILIENKIDAPLFVKQLTKYSHIHPKHSVKRIALVKNFFEPFADNKGWKILHWGDFYRHLNTGLSRCGVETLDYFIINNFKTHMEEIGMKTVTRITKSELLGLAKAVYKMRSPKHCNFSLKIPAFEIAVRYIKMLKHIVEMTKAEPLIRSAVKKNYRFTPWCYGWYTDTKADRYHFMIGADIRLKRRNHRVVCVGTGILFYDKKPKKYRIATYWQGKDNNFENETNYKGKDLILDKYAKQVISLWKKWLR